MTTTPRSEITASPEPRGASRAIAWLLEPRVALLVVAIVALVTRFAYFAQVRHAPDFETLFSDAGAYDAWARDIASGDWLSRSHGIFFQSPLYPYFLGTFYAVFGRHLMAIRVSS